MKYLSTKTMCAYFTGWHLAIASTHYWPLGHIVAWRLWSGVAFWVVLFVVTAIADERKAKTK